MLFILFSCYYGGGNNSLIPSLQHCLDNTISRQTKYHTIRYNICKTTFLFITTFADYMYTKANHICRTHDTPQSTFVCFYIYRYFFSSKKLLE